MYNFKIPGTDIIVEDDPIIFDDDDLEDWAE